MNCQITEFCLLTILYIVKQLHYSRIQSTVTPWGKKIHLYTQEKKLSGERLQIYPHLSSDFLVSNPMLWPLAQVAFPAILAGNSSMIITGK